MPVAKSDEHAGPRSKRARILAVAIEQFGRNGYDQTKWASVAEEVGIGQTALYHYFESKAHCLLTIIRLELIDSDIRFAELTVDIADPREALRAAVAAALRGNATDSLQRRVLQNRMDILATPRQSAKEENERLQSRELVATITKKWADLIARGQQQGVFVDDVAPALLARLVLGLLESVWLWYRPEGGIPLDEITETVADSAVRMVTTPAPVSKRSGN